MTDFPDLKLKALVSFPAAVFGGTGIAVRKENGQFFFDLDFGDLAPISTAAPNEATTYLAMWEQTHNIYSRMSVSDLKAEFGSGGPATLLPLVESGAGAVGVSLKYAREDHVHPAAAGGAAGDPVTIGGSAFAGRLTPQAGVPVPNVDIGSTALCYSPINGRDFLVRSSGAWQQRQFTSGPTDMVGLILNMAGSSAWLKGTVHDVFGIIDAGVAKLATRQWDAGMFPTESLIASIGTAASPPGTPGRINTGTGANIWGSSSLCFDGVTSATVASGLFGINNPSNTGVNNALGQFWGTGAQKLLSSVKMFAPSDDRIRGDGFSALTVQTSGSNDGANWHLMSTIRIDNSIVGGVFSLPANLMERARFDYHRVNIEGNNSNALRVVEVQFFEAIAPAAGRRLTWIDGFPVNDNVVTVRTSPTTTVSVPQYDAVFLGTIQINPNSDGTISDYVTFGPQRIKSVWNNYNRRRTKLIAGTYPPFNVYTPNTSQRWNPVEGDFYGATAFSLQFVSGLPEDWATSELKRTVFQDTQANNASYEAGIGVDTGLTFSGVEASFNIDTAGPGIGSAIGIGGLTAMLSIPPFVGGRVLYGIERQGNSGTGPQSLYTGPRSAELNVDFMA